jgi:hypothetical protein
MPSQADIIRDSIVDFSRLQDWMLSAKAHGDMNTYDMMFKRYLELKVILSSLGVSLVELDRING